MPVSTEDRGSKYKHFEQYTDADASELLTDYSQGGGGGYSTGQRNKDNNDTRGAVPEQNNSNDDLSENCEELSDYIYVAEIYNNNPVYQNINENISWIPASNFCDIEQEVYTWDTQAVYEKLHSIDPENINDEDSVIDEFEDNAESSSPEAQYEYSVQTTTDKKILPYFAPTNNPEEVTFRQRRITLIKKNSDSSPSESENEVLEQAIEQFFEEYQNEDLSLDYERLKEDGYVITNTNPALLEAQEGDCFYDRWECLKTYPTTDKDYNQIVDVISVPVETYVNLNARTDRNRGTKNGTIISDKNFNLFNPVYNQRNNLFLYYSNDLVNGKESEYDTLSNCVAWSLTKNNGEEIDNWTTITQASVVDLDGVNGSLTKLELWNDKLLAFQEKAINYIPFNARVAIETNDGVPIEIANSGKVDMPVIMTNKIGCQNKWSICGTERHLYFIDNYKQGIYRLGGESGFQNLSDTKGFHSWMNENNYYSVWNPEQQSNFKTTWDSINNEIMFIDNNTCLAFNENLDEFTSFYSYEGTPYIEILGNNTLALREGTKRVTSSHVGVPPWFKTFTKLYVLHPNSNIASYNYFFSGEELDFSPAVVDHPWKPYYIDIIANEGPMTTKIFNTIDYVADVFSGGSTQFIESNYQEGRSFNYISAIDEYQSGEYIIDSTKTLSVDNPLDIKTPYPLKKKFRTWSMNIPRDGDNSNNMGDTFDDNIISGRADRMSNPWIKIRLKRDNSDKNTNKFVLHNLIVNYTEQ